MRSWGYLAIIFTVVFLLSTVVVVTAEQTRASTRGDWIIDSEIVFDSRDVNITNNIYIKSGGILVFRDCTCNIGDLYDAVDYEFVVEQGGRLEIVNSNFTIRKYMTTYVINSKGAVFINNSYLSGGWSIVSEGLTGSMGNSLPLVELFNSTFSLSTEKTSFDLNWSRFDIDSCVFSNNTNDCLLIRNSSGMFKDSRFTDNHRCVYMMDCTGISFEDNYFDYNNYGIIGKRLTRCDFIGQSLYVHPDSALRFYDSSNITFRELELDVSSSTGATFYNCSDVEIKDGKVSRCTGNGMYYYYSWNLTVDNVNFSDNTVGLEIYLSMNIDILNSKFWDNSGDGLGISYSDNIMVDNSEFVSNRVGSGCYSTSDVDLYNSTFLRNSKMGLEISYCDEMELDNLYLYDNGEADLMFENSWDATITGLTVITKETGFQLYSCTNFQFADISVSGYNDLYESDYWRYSNGLDISWCDNCDFENLTIDRCEYALELEDSNECRFSTVRVRDCKVGFVIDHSDYNEFVDINIEFLGNDVTEETQGLKIDYGHYNLVSDFYIGSTGIPAAKGISYSVFNWGYYNMFINGTLNNTYNGIYVSGDSHSTEVYDVNIQRCIYGVKDYGEMNQYRYCDLRNNFYGIFLALDAIVEADMNQVVECDFVGNYIGIKTNGDGQCYFEIRDSLFQNNRFALMLEEEQLGYVEGNTFRSNDYALYLWEGDSYYYSGFREIESDNTNWSDFPQPSGMSLIEADTLHYYSGPEVTDNNFLDNNAVINIGENIYDDTVFIHNFFLSYSGSDTNGDGFGDTAIPVSYCDYLPRMLPYDTDDSDGDGYNDLTEQLSDSDPDNATSVPVDGDGDGIPDKLRTGGSSGPDDDESDNDDGDGPVSTLTFPTSVKMLIILILGCFVLIVVYFYYKKHRDEGTMIIKEESVEITKATTPDKSITERDISDTPKSSKKSGGRKKTTKKSIKKKK